MIGVITREAAKLCGDTYELMQVAEREDGGTIIRGAQRTNVRSAHVSFRHRTRKHHWVHMGLALEDAEGRDMPQSAVLQFMLLQWQEILDVEKLSDPKAADFYARQEYVNKNGALKPKDGKALAAVQAIKARILRVWQGLEDPAQGDTVPATAAEEA